MKKNIFLILLFFMIIPSISFAINVTIEWDANAESVGGYKLYYQDTKTGPPFNGTGATEGNSPIDVGNVTIFSITNLPDGLVYYFSVTAYKGQLESGYSNIVSTDMVTLSTVTGVTCSLKN